MTPDPQSGRMPRILSIFQIAAWMIRLPFILLQGYYFVRIARRGKPGKDILFLSQYQWENIWRRNQHVAKHISGSRKIFYLTTFPFYDMEKFQEPGNLAGRWVSEGIFAISLPVLVGESKIPLIRRINQIYMTSTAITKCRQIGISPGILWFSQPYSESITRYWEGTSVVYDVQDEFPAIPTPSDIYEREVRLLQKSDLVFTGTYSLYLKKREHAKNIHFIACGVDYHHFHQACDSSLEIPPDIASIKAGKTLGYFGAVGERIDWSLLREISVRHPDWAIVLIGAEGRIEPDIKELKNIYFLGVRGYETLPYYIKGFDVCLIPFKLNDYTRYIYPTKLLEYLCAGKPVISSPIPDVERFFSDIVGIAGDIESFEKEMVKIEEDDDRVRKGIEMAQNTSWEKAVEEMEEHMREMLQIDDGRGPNRKDL
jgi:UDP-galactopyranose mutase